MGVDVYVKTLKSDGIQGLYRGFTISAVGIFIYRGMYFGLYDTLKPMLLGADAGVTLSFLLGWGVTVTAGLMSYPIDTVRRRMMNIRRWSQVQGIPGLLLSGSQERGIHVPDEGSWSQHLERCCWSWCLGRIRQVPTDVHCLQNWTINDICSDQFYVLNYTSIYIF